MAAAGGLLPELVGQRGQDAGLVLGLSGDEAGGAFGLEVQDRPQGGCDIQAVQAQVVGFPAGAQGGSQVAVARPVDLLDPPAEPGQRFDAVGGREYNLGLSQRRADAIRAALINPFGVNPGVLQAVGLGAVASRSLPSSACMRSTNDSMSSPTRPPPGSA